MANGRNHPIVAWMKGEVSTRCNGTQPQKGIKWHYEMGELRRPAEWKEPDARGYVPYDHTNQIKYALQANPWRWQVAFWLPTAGAGRGKREWPPQAQGSSARCGRGWKCSVISSERWLLNSGNDLKTAQLCNFKMMSFMLCELYQ